MRPIPYKKPIPNRFSLVIGPRLNHEYIVLIFDTIVKQY
jgi:hypothetical protein